YAKHRANLICRGAERKLAGVWDDGQKNAVRGAFRSTRVPYAETTWSGVVSSLDRYTQGWTAAHTEACEATRVRGEQSEQVLDRRMQCLDDRLSDVRALVTQFAS